MDYQGAADAILQAVPQVTAVYLFGSRASGQAGPESDVDLAVLAARSLDPLVRWRVQEEVAALLHCNVDLVDLRSASTVMRARVLETAVVLHDADPAGRATFEAAALGAYARFNEERRGILDDVRARGSVHG